MLLCNLRENDEMSLKSRSIFPTVNFSSHIPYKLRPTFRCCGTYSQRLSNPLLERSDVQLDAVDFHSQVPTKNNIRIQVNTLYSFVD